MMARSWQEVQAETWRGSAGERTVRCPHCGSLYVWFRHYAGDQSTCIWCRMVARRRDAVSLILARDQHRLLSQAGIATEMDAEYVKDMFRNYGRRTDG